MSNRVYFSGLEKVTRNLNSQIKKIKGRTKAGMWRAGLLVRREAVIITPVDTGNLRNSAFVNSYDTKRGPVVDIGFTASYAPFVHEIDATHHEPTQWKFLETALKAQQKTILAILKATARV